jgi:hypothetical protein
MGKRIDGALVNCLATIEFTDELLAELSNITRYLSAINLSQAKKESLTRASNILHDLLIQSRHDAFESYFMFATVGKEPERKKAIELAYRRFLKSDSDISRYSNTHLISPSRWLSSIDDELRKEIESEINENKGGQ